MSDNVIFLSNVRLSFPHLVEAQVKESGKPSYNAEFLMPQDHPGFQQFMKLVGEKAMEKWKEHASNVLNLVNQDRKKRCYGNGNEKVNAKTFQPYDGYANNVYITAGRENAPQIIQADGSPIDPTNTMAYQALTRAMYGGCRVNVAVKPWLQDNKHGRGVRCELIAVQFAGDDTPFGEGVMDASGMFGAVALAEHKAPTPAGIPFTMGNPAPAAPAPAMPAPPFAQAPTVPGLPSFLS